MRAAARALVGLVLIVSWRVAMAHVGSPDVYVKATAGPYDLLVSVHPPAATPGAAEVDVRAVDSGATEITVSVLGSAQTPETLKRFSAEQSFTGSVWVAAAGAWRVRIHVRGSQGEAETTVPIPVSPASQQAQGAARWRYAESLLWLAGAALLGIGALVLRRTQRTPSALFLFGAAFLIVVGVARTLRSAPPVAPPMQVTLLPGGRLSLALPTTADLVPDHNHLMHLFAIREPEMDVIMHLHPDQLAPGRFELQLPSMPPGAYELFADVVERNGTPLTFVASAGLPFQTGHALAGDDALGVVPGLRRADPAASSIRLADGYRMTFLRPATLHPRAGQMLRFALFDPAGNPPADMQLYMGMAAHAAVVKTDGTVFAHIHPAGNIPMAAYGMDMKGMEMSATPASEVSFPFGFPVAGQYRIFVEMKHGTTVETGAFDVSVE